MSVQTSLFDEPEPERKPSGVDPSPDRPATVALPGGLVRHRLLGGAWVDLLPGWLAGSPGLLNHLLEAVDWQAERRQMYDREVQVPRLLGFYGEGDRLPHPDLEAARTALDAHYEAELGEPFRTAGLCLYRDGADSVAWHGDTIGRGARADTMVAILSLGSPREFLLRPRSATTVHRRAGIPPGSTDQGGGSPPILGRTIRHTLRHGDLIVMGGSCQRTWEHAVPKTTRPVGPRISVQFRPRGVR